MSHIHHVSVEGGEQVVIDLGGWGITVDLDPEKRWYDVEYVKIRYTPTGPKTRLVRADMVVDHEGREYTFKQARAVKIWRHGE